MKENINCVFVRVRDVEKFTRLTIFRPIQWYLMNKIFDCFAAKVEHKEIMGRSSISAYERHVYLYVPLAHVYATFANVFFVLLFGR